MHKVLIYTIEVEYDSKRDEKEKHEAKMREVRAIEEFRKEQEAQRIRN